MWLLRRGLIIIMALAALAGLTVSGTNAAKPEIYAEDGGILSVGPSYALNGYDPVSYFTRSGPEQGSDNFTYMWKGALWRFATRQNLEKFVERPEAFAPQYGGYCAWNMAHGRTAPGDPNVWAIHNGKLYVTRNRSVKRKWDKNRDALITQANANWPAILEE